MSDLLLAAMPDGAPEIFYSIQGEGPRTGRPSLFVRLSDCNLHCRWCDTAYTWRWTDRNPHERAQVFDKETWQVRISQEDLLRRIRRHPFAPAVVFTGGEPLLQHRALTPLIRAIKEVRPSCAVEFETNGTLYPGEELLRLTDLFVVSPKLSNAGMDSALTERPALKRFAELSNAVFKMVVASPEDIYEAVDMVRRYDVPPQRTYLMPCGRTSEALSALSRHVADACLEHGYTYSDRLHVHLFGEAQGT